VIISTQSGLCVQPQWIRTYFSYSGFHVTKQRVMVARTSGRALGMRREELGASWDGCRECGGDYGKADIRVRAPIGASARRISNGLSLDGCEQTSG
jgi:hypothetical protein